MDWKAYVFCALESFHRLLRRREVFTKNSSKWGDPRAKLLDGEAWEQVRPTVLASLNLPAEARAHAAATTPAEAGRTATVSRVSLQTSPTPWNATPG